MHPAVEWSFMLILVVLIAMAIGYIAIAIGHISDRDHEAAGVAIFLCAFCIILAALVSSAIFYQLPRV